AGTNAKLTFGGAPGLTLAPDQGAWSDPVAFQVKAFQRLTVSVNVSSASDVSMHTLGLVTSYLAPGRDRKSTRLNSSHVSTSHAPSATLLPYTTLFRSCRDEREADLWRCTRLDARTRPGSVERPGCLPGQSVPETDRQRQRLVGV